MTTIKATCPSCGEVELTAADVRLRVCTHPDLSHYAFDCPECLTEVRKEATDNVISLLIAGGVVAEVWEVPEEAMEHHHGFALTYDDLLDFMVELTSCTDIAALVPASPIQ